MNEAFANSLIGFLLTFGVFQNYYSTHAPSGGNKNVPIIGVLGTGIVFLGAPVMTPISKRYRHWQRQMIVFGWTLCVLGLIGASFCNSVITLIITQGIVYGLGFLILYYPLLSMLNEWFDKRRGLAYGILFGAAGISGIVLPFIFEVLLKRYGYKTTLRGYAIALLVLSGPVLPLLKGRLPARSSASAHKTDHSFFHRPLFYFLAASNLFQGFAFYLPFLYLPSYASVLGYSTSKGALLLALVNVAQIIGQAVFGQLSDRLDIHVLLFASSAVSAVALFTLWGLAGAFGPLVVFSLLYGWFAAGYVVLWPRFGTTLSDDPMAAQSIYSVLAFEKGVGNVLAGPISSALMKRRVEDGAYGIGRFEGVVLFAGGCMALSSLGVLGWFVRKH